MNQKVTESKKIIGNWKMNLTSQEITNFFLDLERELKVRNINLKDNIKKIMVGSTPTFAYLNLSTLQESAEKLGIFIGGQDVSGNDQGAFTGEVSAKMLKDSQCDYVLIGHSERRAYHNENNVLLSKKIIKALENGLQPIFCIGETESQYNANQTNEILENQIKAIDFELLKRCWIAYEPVWAIGTGKSAQVEDIKKVHEFIYNIIDVPLLYGGSVTDKNADEILKIDHVDGVLVGGASLKADLWIKIIEAGLNNA